VTPKDKRPKDPKRQVKKEKKPVGEEDWGGVIVKWLCNLASPSEASLPFPVRVALPGWGVADHLEGGEGVEWREVPDADKIQLHLLEPGHEGDAPSPQPLSMATVTSRKIAWPERSLSSQYHQRWCCGWPRRSRLQKHGMPSR
jgi:hypothetical protein